MKKHSLKINIQFIFLFLFLLISNIICKDSYKDNISKSINGPYFLQNDIKDNLLPGKVYNLNLYSSNITNIIFEKGNEEYDILVHFYPLECKIHLSDSNEREDKIHNISNYNYGAFYTLITENDISSFIVKPLIYSSSEEIKNIFCPLIINVVKIYQNGIPELELNEKEPILFHFRDKVPELKLTYNYNNNGKPIIISFFIKEKARFEIEYSDGETKTKKTIYYKETILIKPSKSKTKLELKIKRSEQDQVDSTMTIKISGNNSSSFYLQKNILNLGFIPKDELCQYYYMKVYKGQEGEILLNNKRLNGMLLSKIINWNEKDNISNIKNYPECKKIINLSNQYLQYDEYNKKVSFNSSNTNDCGDNCYLLVTYYSEQHNYINITGNEYTLLTRIWDEEDFISQIVNIPLNEYIFGVIDNTTINIHYYSVYIPDESDNITIELHGENIISFAKKGIKKINTFKITQNTKQLNSKLNEKLIINLNKNELGLKSFKGQYISFAFKKGNDDQFSYYYFRILQPNNNNITIYPLDTNKNGLCETKKINGSFSCYFLLKNEYQELENKLVFYAFGQKDIYYTIYYIYNNDDYSINLENLNQSKKYRRTNGYLRYYGNHNNSNFVVIKINSKFNESINFLSNFYEINEFEQTYDIYSNQLFYLYSNTTTSFNINQNILKNYRVFINNIGGKGSLIFNNFIGKRDDINLGGKNSYSFSIDNESKNISIFSERNLAFNLKINYQISYEFMDELDCQYNKRDIVNQDNFPLIYYLKDIKNEGVDINLYFKFKKDNINNDFIITAGVIDYKDFKEIKDKDEVEQYLHSKFTGLYNPAINSGLIVFDRNIYANNKKYKKKPDDEYSFIIIDKDKSKKNHIREFNLEFNVIPKNDDGTFLIENKYVQSSFNLKNKEYEFKKFFIDRETVEESEFYLEFSSNYQNTYIEFNNITKLSENTIGNVKQYYLSISNETYEYSFTVTVNRSKTSQNPRFRPSINLIYYLKDKKIDLGKFLENFDISWEKSNIDSNKLKKNMTVLVKNNQEINDSSIAYFYYLRFINQKDLIENEILNTIAPIFSKTQVLFNNNPNSHDLSYNFNCDIEKEYTASLLIKIIKDSKIEKYERYYSIPFSFNTNKNFFEKNKIIIIIISFVIVLIIISIIFLLYLKRSKKKNKSLEDKVRAISFSEGIEEDSSNINFSEKSSKISDDYENTFI